jgi:hypothetical protein
MGFLLGPSALHDETVSEGFGGPQEIRGALLRPEKEEEI